ncbi:uncharacterized protein Spn85F [Fopius arisanus]|uniref:Serpinb1a protein n=1 Tax=Fopius arisanus TaxID=64838 RepID=A0A0C9QY64_9HYME|nr:PREDICTED: uncharacterized protein LOC105262837 [Fopius arisanus]
MNVWLVITLLLGVLNLGDGVPWRPSVGPPSRPPGRPVNIMTDVINDLGVKLLDCYMEHSGNIAFSPTGLAFVLAALYEGSAGRTTRQIAQVLALPRDRRVTEIGLRDIHRRLRSYLNADAFLGGLTLNRDDIILRPEYEDTLRFYGFDVGDNQGNSTGNVNSNATDLPTTPAGQMADNNGTTTPGPVTGVTDSTGSTSSMMMVTAPMPPAMTNLAASIDTTINPMVELISPSPSNASLAAISAVNGTTETPTTTPISQTTTSTTGDTENSGNSTTNNQGTDSVMVTTLISTPAINSTSSSQLGNNSAINNSQASVLNVTDTATLVTTGPGRQGMNNSAGNDTSARSAGETSLRNLNNTGNSTMTGEGSVNSSSETITEGFALIDAIEGMSQSAGITANDENKVRKKRSIGSQRFSSYPGEPLWIDEVNGWQEYNPSGPSGEPLINEDMTDLQFLVNGCDPSTISTASYTAVLPFAYIPSVRAFGVEFPLDDPRYNVILLVPTEHSNSRILGKLLLGKTLRQIRGSMRSTWIRATIPSFMLRGFITLTPYLQKMGIGDAFDPRAADLTPMSSDLGIYARDVQQSIGVNIRNYGRDGRNDSTDPSTPRSPYQQTENYLHSREPIAFTVDRPFLFFIVDTETSVALIAGRVDDPLNSRIL